MTYCHVYSILAVGWAMSMFSPALTSPVASCPQEAPWWPPDLGSSLPLNTKKYIKYWKNCCFWQNCPGQQLFPEVGRWGQGCPAHLLCDGTIHGGSLGAGAGASSASLLPPQGGGGCGDIGSGDVGGGDQLRWPLPPCTGDSYSFPCRWSRQKAF